MMKNWQQAAAAYKADHLSKPLKAPSIRLNALTRIENTLRTHLPEMLDDPQIFQKIAKPDFADRYERLKGAKRNSAETSVINGLYRFAAHD